MKQKFSKLHIVFLLLGIQCSYAQYGFGTKTPDKSSVVEVKSDRRGLLIPRIQLESLTSSSPIKNPQNSLLVFNTSTTSDLEPGYYYWYDDKWIRLATNLAGSTGNTYQAGEGMFLTGNTFHRKGLEEVVEGTTGNEKKGWRYIGMPASQYANTGKYATDLSYIPMASNESESLSYDNYNLNTGALSYSGNTTYEYLKEDIITYIPSFPFNEVGASGDYALNTGLYNIASNFGSTAFGLANQNRGEHTVVSGSYNVALGRNSAVFGENLYSDFDNQLVVGTFNCRKQDLESGSPRPRTSVANTRNGLQNSTIITPYVMETVGEQLLFTVGNGYFDYRSNSNIRSDAFTVLASGRVGINIDHFQTTGSDANLQVNGAVLIGNFADTADPYGTAPNIDQEASNYTSAMLDVRGGVKVGEMDDSCASYNEGSIRYVKQDDNNGHFEGCVKDSGIYKLG